MNKELDLAELHTKLVALQKLRLIEDTHDAEDTQLLQTDQDLIEKF